jgi:hypothetical protein
MAARAEHDAALACECTVSTAKGYPQELSAATGGREKSEFVPQGKLHHPRVREQLGVMAKGRALVQSQRQARRIKARRVGNVKDFPTELQGVMIRVRHLPALAQAHIQAEEPIAAQNVAASPLAGIIMAERLESSGGSGENIHRAVAVLRRTRCRVRPVQHSPSKRIPVGGPRKTVAHTNGEAAGPPVDAGKLPATHHGEIGEFFTRLDSLFALWKRGGFWDYAHPWMECVLPWQTTAPYISQVLANLPPQALVGGHILLWPARGNTSSAPLFMRPQSEFVMGFGILPAVPPQFLDEVLPRMNMASQASIMMGGKRYLSGWITCDHAAWKAHYGEMWPTVAAAKRKFDPQGILNPGFIKFE